MSEHEKSTPDIVQKAMQLLQESWANLAEKEDGENRDLISQVQYEIEARMAVTRQKDT